MAHTYILFSEKTDSFYIGSCKNLEERLIEHKAKIFEKSYTSNISDWELFFSINDISYSQARKIEIHIKKMKSKLYILNLKLYPEISKKLILKYKD